MRERERERGMEGGVVVVGGGRVFHLSAKVPLYNSERPVQILVDVQLKMETCQSLLLLPHLVHLLKCRSLI